MVYVHWSFAFYVLFSFVQCPSYVTMWSLVGKEIICLVSLSGRILHILFSCLSVRVSFIYVLNKNFVATLLIFIGIYSDLFFSVPNAGAPGAGGCQHNSSSFVPGVKVCTSWQKTDPLEDAVISFIT